MPGNSCRPIHTFSITSQQIFIPFSHPRKPKDRMALVTGSTCTYDSQIKFPILNSPYWTYNLYIHPFAKSPFRCLDGVLHSALTKPNISFPTPSCLTLLKPAPVVVLLCPNIITFLLIAQAGYLGAILYHTLAPTSQVQWGNKSCQSFTVVSF